MVFTIKAQNYTINQGGSHTSCAVRFLDSGDSTDVYQNNESYTITFCSDGSGQSNSVNAGFGEMFKIDPSDTLFVFDGNSISSPLIGAYNNNNPPVGVSSTTANTSGCLTFHFVADAAIIDSGWISTINCVKICQPIHPIITTTPPLVSYGPDSNYTNICAGDVVSFSASGTYPHNGINGVNYPQSNATSTFAWNFGEGTELTGQTGNITYNNQGGYAVLLTVTDANNCQEQIIHKVRTGITPNFSGIYALPDTTCFGDTIQLLGGFNQTTSALSGVTPNTGAITAGGTVTGQTFLPDGNGNSYTTSVSISGFSGQTITSGTDVAEICMNIEHSYIGDLDFQLTCPNGTSIILSDTYGGTGSGSTFLGDANDDGTNVPGIGLDYCFTLGAIWGTMDTENAASNWIPSTVTPGNNILTPGNFQPEQSFNNLVGCPIDGNWTITVTDNLSIDNGYIFEWGITLNPAINPNAEFYNVAIVDGFWVSSPDFVVAYDTMTVVAPQNEGNNSYIFTVKDEYGCFFDTTINVVVLQELIAVASPDTNLCVGQQVTLDVGGASSNCNYNVDLFDSWGDGWNTGGSVNILINGILYLANQTVPDCNGSTSTGCHVNLSIPVTTGDVISFDYTSGSFNSENTITLYNSDGIEVFTVNDPVDGIQTITTAECAGGLAFSWWPTSNLSDPLIPNPIFNGTTTSTYAVEVLLNGHPECSVISDSITITISNTDLPTIVGDSAICYGGSATYTINGADSILWANGSNDSTITFSPQNDSLLIVTALTACGAVSWSKHIVVYPKIDIIATPDTVICKGQPVNLNLNGILNECTYLLTLIDSAGNGWGSLEGVNVKINGILYETGVSVPDCNGITCQYSLVIPVNNGDILTLEYSSGATNNENSIKLFDASNTQLFTTTSPVAGLLGTFTTTCNNAYNINWSPTSQLSNPSIINPVFGAVSSQNYQATVSLKTNTNCINSSNTIHLDVRSIEIPVIIGDSSICIGETVTLSINADSVLWWGDTTNVSTSFTFSPQSDSVVSATASTFCIQDTVVTYFVGVNPLPTITTIADTNLTIQQSITLTTVGGVSYYWIPDLNLSCNGCSSPIASPIESTTYNVIVTDSNGCVSSKSIHIDVLIPDLFIPTGFSPNNDGVNDVIFVRSLSIASMSLQIFDRWGGLVFESSKQEKGWDGTANGKKLDAGVYVFKFEATLLSGDKIEQSGNITLFR